MTDHSFTTTATVENTADDVYAAINQPRTWWSTAIEGFPQ